MKLEWWIDYSYWPGPEETTPLEDIRSAIRLLGLSYSEAAKNIQQAMKPLTTPSWHASGLAVDLAKHDGMRFSSTGTPVDPMHFEAPDPPPKIPKHVGPRRKFTFGRGGKRNF